MIDAYIFLLDSCYCIVSLLDFCLDDKNRIIIIVESFSEVVIFAIFKVWADWFRIELWFIQT